MSTIEHLARWETVVGLVAIYSVAPYLVLWLVIRCWPKGHHRRAELLGEYGHVPVWRRPFWVGDAAIMSILDGGAARLSQTRSRLLLTRSIAGRIVLRGVALAVGGVAVAVAVVARFLTRDPIE